MRFTRNASYGQQNFLRPELGNGKVFIVGDSSSVNIDMIKGIWDLDPDGDVRYLATIDAAINQCTANAGDRIFVLPGHAETLSDATSLNLDIAGVSVIGLGEGTDRPTITFDTATAATIPVSAANVTVKNLILTANFADIVAPFTLTTAKNFKLESCFIKATAVDMNFLNVVDTSTVAAAADGLAVINCKWIEPDTATLSLVKLDADNSDVSIIGNFVQLGVKNNTAALMTIINASSVFNLQMLDNRVFRLNTDTATGAILLHTNQSDNSGIVAGNFAQHADTGAELLITASSGLGTFSNYASGVPGASGYLLPAADS